jgi:hypothetical protein
MCQVAWKHHVQLVKVEVAVINRGFAVVVVGSTSLPTGTTGSAAAAAAAARRTGKSATAFVFEHLASKSRAHSIGKDTRNACKLP